MEKITFTRSELYTLVWKFPMLQIARHYDVSTMGIRNACQKMIIPLPDKRYWTTLPYKRKAVPKLSADYKGLTTITIFRKNYEMQFRKTIKTTPLLDLAESIKKDKNVPLYVHPNFNEPVAIVVNTLQNWKGSKEIYDNNSKQDVLNLDVSDQSLNRALLFMDAFIKVLHHRGHQFEARSYKTGTVILFGNIEITIYLREARRRIITDVREGKSEYIFAGELIFGIKKNEEKKEWRDGNTLLEDNLALIVARLEIMAEEEKKWIEAGLKYD